MVHAEFSSTSITDDILIPDAVFSIIGTDTRLFLGGDFERIFTPEYPATITEGLLLSATTSLPVPDNASVGGEPGSYIRAAVYDGEGGYYIGGDLDEVGGLARTGVAHILPDGSVDPDFAPTSDGDIYSLALSPDGSVLYVGGSFTTMAGTSQVALAAVDVDDGTIVAAFDPLIEGGSPPSVTSIAISPDGTVLYAGGPFNSVNATSYPNGFAAVSTSNGSLAAPLDTSDLLSSPGSILASPDDEFLYLTGIFTFGGRLGKMDTTTGSSTEYSVPAGFFDDGIGAAGLSQDGSILYVSNYINTGPRIQVLALATSDGTSHILAAEANHIIRSITTSADGDTVYIGGIFSSVDGEVRRGIAALDASTGELEQFDAGLYRGSDVYAIAASADSDHLYVGGSLPTLGGIARGKMAAFDIGDLDIDASFTPEVDDTISAGVLSSDGTTLYIGGYFTSVDGTPRAGLAAIDTSDGSLISAFDSSIDDGEEVLNLALSPDDSVLYVAGKFTSVGGSDRNRIAALDTSDGSLISAFDPDANGTVATLALSSDGNTLYLGGDFTTIGATTRNRLAAVNTSNGALVSGFNPNVTHPSGGGGGGNAGVRALALSSDGSKLYVGGGFTKIGGVTRNRLGLVSTSDGALDATFNPNADSLVREMVLSPDGSSLYATGQFTEIGGESIMGLASLDAVTGVADGDFSQDLINAGVAIAITPDATKLFVSNGYNAATFDNYFIGFADGDVTPDPDTAPTVASAAASGLTTTGATLNGSISATGGDNATTRGFVHGTTISYGATTTESGSFSTGSYSSALSSLTCATEYHFKAYATNGVGTGYGSDLTFNTSACDVPEDDEDEDSGGGGGGGSSHRPSPSASAPPSGTSAAVTESVRKLIEDNRSLLLEALKAGIQLPPALLALLGGSVPQAPSPVRDLELGSQGEDVRALQKYLNTHGFPVAGTGAGSSGNETTYFGNATRAALILFQKAKGITPAVGYFGPKTRSVIAF
ncbi:MAG: peptidoglycan-binding protein [Patescibacteria group bacterium]